MATAAFDNSGRSPLRVPGFQGISVENSCDPLNSFCSNDYSAQWRQLPRVTARELAMLDVMAKITDKPNWDTKILDDTTVQLWHKEALAAPLMSEQCWDWCMAELRDKASMYRDTGHLIVLDVGACVYKSDKNVPSSISEELRAATPSLFAQYHKDWARHEYPQKLDLVDPSLFLLKFNWTPVLVEGGCIGLEQTFDFYGQGQNAADPDHPNQPKDQWLPCEVEFSATKSDTEVHITSYINNLHPIRYRSLYKTIEGLISLAIEPWNKVLIENAETTYLIPEDTSSARQLVGRVPMRIRTFGADLVPAYPYRLYFEVSNPDLCLTDDGGQAQHGPDDNEPRSQDRWNLRAKVEEYLKIPEGGTSTPVALPNDWDADLRQSVIDKARRICHLQLPEPGTAFSYQDWTVGKTSKAVVPSEELKWGDHSLPDRDHIYAKTKLEETFKEKGLQIVVRISSIELTPEQPFFPQETWTQDGMGNDCLVGTAVYYYDVDNISEAALSFQQSTDMYPEWYPYAENDYGRLIELFGVQDAPQVTSAEPPDANVDLSGSMAQLLGTSTITSGRFLAWSSAIKHRIESFKLSDSSKPGHCRFITLYLVDPHVRLCSTRNVPPQRHDWWEELAAANARLPSAQDVQKPIMSLSEIENWPMILHEGRLHKRQRDEDRAKFDKTCEDSHCSINFSHPI